MGNSMKFNKKEYQRTYYLRNREEEQKKAREYYHKNKEICKERQKKYTLQNKEKRKKYLKNWRLKNSGYNKKYNIENKEKIKKKRREYDLKEVNRERKNKKRREYNLIPENNEKKKKRSKEWRLKHKERISKEKRIRRIFDHNYRIKCCLRGRIRNAMKGKSKSAGTMELLGCSIEELWSHFESKFEPGMTKQNHGEWHIDHIKPCDSFNLTDPAQQRECFHYTNLQPLWAFDNISKGNKIL